MTALLYVLGVLFVVLGVGLSIGLHEIGHLVPAKKFGVKVTQYMVGFGPTLWSTKRGETEYGIKAIPLGGYIRMIGMFPPRPGDKPGTLRVSSTGRFTQLADEARQLSLEEIKPGDEDRVFYKLSVPKKVVVMMGGPVMNLVIAVVLLTGILTMYGVATVQDGARVATVSECVVSAKDAATKTTCAASDPKTPAYTAGVQPGDQIVSVAGERIRRTADVGRLMMYLLGVLVVAVGVGASIALHEIGHLVPAKRFGVKVTQYMVGFGPTIWSRHRGETEYGVKAIPLGGYIRMIGMFPPRPGDKPGTLRVSSTGRFSQLMDEARQASLEEVQPGDERRVFYKLTVPRKVTVMLGGPVMNLLIATVLFGGIFTLYGLPEITPKLSSVSQCVDVKQAGQTSAAACTPDMPVAPANAAGLKPGDTLLSIAGTKVSTWDDVRKAIRGNLDKPMAIVYERDCQRRTVVAKPLVLDLPVYDDQGQPTTNDAGKVVTERAGFLGTSGTPEIVPQPVTAVPGLIGEQIGRTAGVVLKIPEKMVGVAKAAFGSGQRDPEGPISVVGVGRVAGEVANADTSAIKGGTMAKFVTLIGLIASLNLALFVFNLIPLLPLDGGHVAGALWEGVKRHTARLLNRPDPGYVDVAKALPVAYAVSSVLIVMSVLLIYADIVNPVRLGG